eukprot:2323835-Rhodomonas_salina.2
MEGGINGGTACINSSTASTNGGTARINDSRATINEGAEQTCAQGEEQVVPRAWQHSALCQYRMRWHHALCQYRTPHRDAVPEVAWARTACALLDIAYEHQCRTSLGTLSQNLCRTSHRHA